ncbi:TIGR04255 family protein [bacterium]|nr:TIGR04255 family protein [bacterium]
MKENSSSFAEYENPPVSEVALSIQFESLQKLKTPYIGLLWQKYIDSRSKLNKVWEQPLLKDRFELFHDEKLAPRIELSNIPPLQRYWFLNESETELVQIQDNRFVRNWRRLDTSKDYPRYNKNREDFIKDFEIFETFLKEHNIGEILPNQCEVTYVNPIPAEGKYERPDQLHNVVTFFQSEYSDSFLPDLENINFTLQYVIQKEDSLPLGRLYISLQSVTSKDNSLIYLIKLVARGKPIGEGIDGVLGFMDIGHEWIVRGFSSVTASYMHELWGRKYES